MSRYHPEFLQLLEEIKDESLKSSILETDKLFEVAELSIRQHFNHFPNKQDMMPELINTFVLGTIQRLNSRKEIKVLKQIRNSLRELRD